MSSQCPCTDTKPTARLLCEQHRLLASEAHRSPHNSKETGTRGQGSEVRELSLLLFLLTPCCQSSQGGSNKAHLAPAHQDHSPVLCPFSLLFQISKSSNVVLPPILLAASPPQQLLNLSKDLNLRWETQSRGQQLPQTGLREAVQDQPATNRLAEARWPGNISSLPVKQGVCIPQGQEPAASYHQATERNTWDQCRGTGRAKELSKASTSTGEKPTGKRMLFPKLCSSFPIQTMQSAAHRCTKRPSLW